MDARTATGASAPRVRSRNGKRPGDVSVVIRALNEAEHLGRLFSALAAQTVEPREVILVDSGSTDGSPDIARAHGARVLHIEPADFSFGRSLNLGCAAASGRFLVFVSAHVYPGDETWLERLLAPFADGSVALSYGRQTGDHRSTFSELELMRHWFPTTSNFDQQDPFCNNANCAIRRDLWTSRPYDEELTGLEDLAWSRNIQAEGFKVAYVADALVHHIHQERFRSTVNRYRREAIAHRQICPTQSLTLHEALVLYVAHVGRDYVAAARRGALGTNLSSIPKFRFAQMYGSWRGFRQRDEPTQRLKRRFYYPKNVMGPATMEPGGDQPGATGAELSPSVPDLMPHVLAAR